MKDLMDTIMTIDKKADQKLKEAMRRKEEAIEEINQRKIELTQGIESHAKERLAESERAEQSVAEDNIAEIKQRAEAEHQRLQGIYDAHQEVWISQITESILGR